MDHDGEYVALCQDLGPGVKRMPLLSAVEASACAVSTLASANANWICVQCEEYHHMADAAFACMWHEIGIRLYLFMPQWPAPFQVELLPRIVDGDDDDGDTGLIPQLRLRIVRRRRHRPLIPKLRPPSMNKLFSAQSASNIKFRTCTCGMSRRQSRALATFRVLVCKQLFQAQHLRD